MNVREDEGGGVVEPGDGLERYLPYFRNLKTVLLPYIRNIKRVQSIGKNSRSVTL